MPSASLPICQVTGLESGDDDNDDDGDVDKNDGDGVDDIDADDDDDDNLAKVVLCFTPNQCDGTPFFIFFDHFDHQDNPAHLDRSPGAHPHYRQVCRSPSPPRLPPMPPRPLSFGPAPTMTMSSPQVRVITFLIIELRSNHSNFEPVVLIHLCTDLSPHELNDVTDFEDG